MSSQTGSHPGATDVPSLKFEHDDPGGDGEDGSRHRLSTPLTQPTPSPLHSQSSGAGANTGNSAHANAASFSSNYFVPISTDDDTPMTDATDTTTTATEKMGRKVERSPTGSAHATKKARPRGGASSRGGGAPRGRNGSGAVSRGGGSRGAASRGGGSHRNLLKLRGGGGMSKSTSSSNGRSSKAGTSASPSPSIKHESEAASSGDDDDNDVNGHEEEDEEAGVEEAEISDSGPYCICRGPDNHRWMIQCDQCEDWFHGDCVKINKEIGENLINSYICPNCTVPNRYVTRYRKLCSLASCRKPARLYADDGASAATPAETSNFCSDAHRDQWWDNILASMERRKTAGGDSALSEDKMPVDQLTPAQLIAVLASSNQDGVAAMLLEGLTRDGSVDPDALLTDEERSVTSTSAAHRYHLAEQLVMCKKMLELLDMAKTRNYEAIKAGIIERDCCGYDDRLQHVGVQPHFGRFLASPEGVAIFQAGQLGPPAPPADAAQADETREDGAEEEEEQEENADAVAGMCRKRKCKAHLGWLPTLARDVRMQMQELAREAAIQRDNETRIRLAAIQRAFVKQHTVSEVRFVGDSDNSLSSLGGGSEEEDDNADGDDDEEEDDDDDDDDNEDEDEDDEDEEEEEKDRSEDGRRYTAPRSPAYHGYSRSYRSSEDREGGKYTPDNHRPNGHASGHLRNGASPRSVSMYSD